MAQKKQFTSMVSGLLNDNEVKDSEPTQTITEPATKKNPVGRPKKNLDKFGRTSLIVNLEYMDKIRVISFKENIDIKDIIEEAFKGIVSRYEAKNGVIEVARNKGSKTINDLF